MAYNITGNISEASRIIVLDESNMSIESNTTHSGGAFDVEANDANNKIIIARKNDGESFGYGAITPIITGPPTGEDFSAGIDDWTVYKTNIGEFADWYENNSLRISINPGSSGANDYARVAWNYLVSGEEWDVEVGYQFIAHSGSTYHCSLRMVFSSDIEFGNQIVIMYQVPSSGMRSYWWDGSSARDQVRAGTIPNPYDPGLRFRITKSGNVFTTYHDLGDGTWQQINQFTSNLLANGIFAPTLSAQRIGGSSIQVKFDNFKVNSGTLTY